jgi:hypothetical protein
LTLATAVPVAATSGRTSPEAGSAARDRCPRAPRAETPAGPSAKAVVVQQADDADPRIEMVRYPRPSSTGSPWSQWGQGLVLADGRFVSAIGNHLGKDGNSFLFVYDPESHAITRFADVRSELGDDRDWGYGKIHGQIVAGPCREAYFTTYWGTRTGLAFTKRYRGDVMFRLDTSSLGLEALGAVLPERGIPSLAGSRGRLVYGEAVDPRPEQELGYEQGDFFVYDTRRETVVFRSDVEAHTGFRNVMVDAHRNAYVAAMGGRLLKYERARAELREHDERLPGGGTLRASAQPTHDGTVYGVTQNPDRFFAMRPDGSIDSLGPARGYTTSIAVEPDGSRIYSVPGAHGGAPETGTPLVALDPRTGQQTTIARLDDLAARRLKLWTSGSYNVVLDAARRRLYIGLNAGRAADDRWGEVVLAIVDLS